MQTASKISASVRVGLEHDALFVVRRRVLPNSLTDGGAFGRGRCDWRDKSSGPPLLKLSSKMKRNNAHSQSFTLVIA